MITSKSPINKTALSHENNLVFQRLMRGHKVNKFKLPVGTCHSRMADIRAYLLKRNIILQDTYIYVGDVRCKEYWLLKEDIEALKKGVEVKQISWIDKSELIKLGFKPNHIYKSNLDLDTSNWRISVIDQNILFKMFAIPIILNISSLKELKQFIKAVKQK